MYHTISKKKIDKGLRTARTQFHDAVTEMTCSIYRRFFQLEIIRWTPTFIKNHQHDKFLRWHVNKHKPLFFKIRVSRCCSTLNSFCAFFFARAAQRHVAIDFTRIKKPSLAGLLSHPVVVDWYIEKAFSRTDELWSLIQFFFILQILRFFTQVR